MSWPVAVAPICQYPLCVYMWGRGHTVHERKHGGLLRSSTDIRNRPRVNDGGSAKHECQEIVTGQGEASVERDHGVRHVEHDGTGETEQRERHDHGGFEPPPRGSPRTGENGNGLDDSEGHVEQGGVVLVKAEALDQGGTKGVGNVGSLSMSAMTMNENQIDIPCWGCR